MTGGMGTGAELDRRTVGVGLLALLAGCGGGSDPAAVVVVPGPVAATPAPTVAAVPRPEVLLGITAVAVASLTSPWSLTVLPSGDMLVGQRIYGGGAISLVTPAGTAIALTGLPVPNNGVLDIALDPGFAGNRRIFFSYVEIDPAAPRIGRPQDAPNEQPSGVVVASATLVTGGGTARLDEVRTIWRQLPKITTPEISGNYGAKLAFSPDGQFLFIANGDRQELVPGLIESNATSIGKIVRIRPDGTIPAENPFVGRHGALPEIWTKGHRNPYGLAFDAQGRLLEVENGPAGGDELNILLPGRHYGWPTVSNGSDYDGRDIPDHAAGDGFEPPVVNWTPVIAPSDMIVYTGTAFASWRGDVIVSGLASKALIRVRFTGATATEVQRIGMGARIRSIAQAPDGAIWVLEDGTTARLLKLAPVPL